MSERVGIVGSRTFPDLDKVKNYIDQLPADVTVVSGDHEHVDRFALRYAKTRGLATEKRSARWQSYGAGAGPFRNQYLVDGIDRLVAFIDSSPCRGTRDAVRRARAKGLPVEVYLP